MIYSQTLTGVGIGFINKICTRIIHQRYFVHKGLIAALLSLTQNVSAGDFKDGSDALGRGDYKAAFSKFLIGARQGNAHAQFNLGAMYYLGHGVLEDYARSHMWFNIASSNGHKDGGRGRDEVAKRMTAQQIAEAQRMARECVNSGYKKCN